MNRRQFLRSSIAVAVGAAVAPAAMALPTEQVTATSIAMSNGPTIGEALRTATSCENDFMRLSQMMAERMYLNQEVIIRDLLKSMRVPEDLLIGAT